MQRMDVRMVRCRFEQRTAQDLTGDGKPVDHRLPCGYGLTIGSAREFCGGK